DIDTQPQTFTFGKFSEVSDLTSQLAVSGATFNPGQTVTLRLGLGPTGLVVSTAGAVLRAPNLAISSVTLHDDGAAGDAVAGDRVFSATFTVPTTSGVAGRWTVDARALGTLGGSAFDRTESGL